MDLYKKLKDWDEKDVYPFHMPGHKRQMQLSPLHAAYEVDITEIDDFDNLHQAKGILLEAQRKVAKLYGAQESFYLVNGSTGGILSAISAYMTYGDKILVSRNCHKSVYNAIAFLGITPIYVQPMLSSGLDFCGPISPSDIEGTLAKNDDVKAVLITSPTYEGIVSDIAAIAKIVHKRNIPLIIDSAHGAHLGLFKEERAKFCDDNLIPPGAVEEGADLVIQSAHKTLPALTQTGVLHYSSNLISLDALKESLAVYQTSSPSYVLMASLDECYTNLKADGALQMRQYYAELNDFYHQVKELKNFHVISMSNMEEFGKAGKFSFDRGKIIVAGTRNGMTGKQIYDILRKRYQIQPEMYGGKYALLMTSIMDSKESWQRLKDALYSMDQGMTLPYVDETEPFMTQEEAICTTIDGLRMLPIQRYTPFEVITYLKKGGRVDTIELSEAVNRISAEYVYFYPPGIPLLVPGEQISKELLALLNFRTKSGSQICGLKDDEAKKIRVI